MVIIQIILVFLAYSPLAAFAVPQASEEAEGAHSALPKNLTNNFLPANKVYSGPWSSFPKMNQWIDFDAMASSFKVQALLHQRAHAPV